MPFFAFPPEIRKMIYTTNAVESLQPLLAQDHQDPRHFPNDEAAIKLLWLAIQTAGAIAVLVLDGAGSHSSPQTPSPGQHRVAAIAPVFARAQPKGKCLGIPARQFAQSSRVGHLRSHPRCLRRRLEQTS